MWTVRYIFFILCLLSFVESHGQISNVYNELRNLNFKITTTDTILGWRRDGNLRLNFGQTHYENWVQNNNSRLDLNVQLNQRIYYQYRKNLWDNQVYLQYGLSKLYGEGLQKSLDRLEVNSIYGKIINPHLSYSYFANFRTQFSNSYDYKRDEKKDYRISGFMSPSFLTTGVGIMWRRNNNLYINLAPVTWRLVSIISPVYKYNNQEKKFINSDETEVFGIPAGNSSIHHLGFNASLYYKLELFKKRWSIENRLALYSNYLSNPKNFDIDYTFNTRYKINKFVSTNFSIQAVYDDDVFAGFQIRENFSIGLNLNI
ncbi:Protein of uncharacterised function (DUF3078) [Candidatus Ornithobacterium hominis]|uniref:Protein of uncharacterized function (DUF3078) n=1 Tax=Candidatus Ornithobacterium hominis TaxID=2497989 RepID=A0A383TW42_9FLAO|nr:DUF3078 domain-containing protein [Candidatus Ornithobacterium hominis]MCT7903874.1 DUF3078 domain-containing protein [Candidatus Ornithobacterium hominis]SZD71216.1 Protein of uncharacterised function (DUF3078) [Candidatus Ornithobacterium hominis]